MATKKPTDKPEAPATPPPTIELSGKKVAVTGKFEQLGRDQIALELQRRGAEVTGSVSGKTDILIAGAKAGSKLATARKFGITVLDEAALVAILATEATVEVAPPEPVIPSVPEAFEGRTIPAFNGRSVVITGSFTAFTKAELGAIIKASGGKVLASATKAVTDVISGDKWGRTLREAMARGASVWTEGEVLLRLEGRNPRDFPEPQDIPNAAHLATLPVLETGECELNMPPGHAGRLTLRWSKVAFRTHRRFAEIWGMMYLIHPEHAFRGELFLDGEPLAPDKSQYYGAESFNMMHFWEDGSDTNGEYLTFDGQHGFNASCLPLRERMHVNWSPNGDTWEFQNGLPGTAWYGDVCSLVEYEYVRINPVAKTWSVNHHAGPYVVRPEQPWGQ